MLYHKKQYMSNAQSDEKRLKGAIKKHVIPVQSNTVINMRIFYKNRTLGSLLIYKKTFSKDVSDRVLYRYKQA